jgi:hypothetical protein
MNHEKSLKTDFTSFSKEQIRDFWSGFAAVTDFRNPIFAYGYHKAIKDNLEGFTSFSKSINIEEKKFTRARIHNSPRTLFPNISDLWYPSPEFVNVGRCNFPNMPVFYCSNDPGTSVFELRPNIGDWLTTVDITIEKKVLELLVLGLDPSDPSFTSLSESDKGINMYLSEKFREIIKKGEEYNYFKTAFFVDAFIKNKDGLIYPSVGSNCKGWNVVFTTDFIDKYAIFERALVHEVIGRESDYDVTIKCRYQATQYNQYEDLIWETITDCDSHKITESIYDHL